MHLLPPQPTNSEIRISGDVEIHPSASIAPGVILQAAPQSRIVIGADVCLGMGVILSVDCGAIEIERGAALGSGVLVIGESKIGNNACVGTATTIFKVSVAAMAVIPPGSLIGDASRPAESGEAQDTVEPETPQPETAKASEATKQTSNSKSKKTKDKPNGFQPSQNSESKPPQQPEAVVGKVYIDSLMMTLFPYKKSPNSNSQAADNNGKHP